MYIIIFYNKKIAHTNKHVNMFFNMFIIIFINFLKIVLCNTYLILILIACPALEMIK
ncbi:MAG: hypothetical protein K0S18_116 [Anaerocolumna sp.]|jgi:hypothetical protein|nr:hypothetical protein [Anaerocolumna sp.]